MDVLDKILSNPTNFGLAFLPRYFNVTPARFHFDIGELAVSGAQKIAIAAPRAHAKSTLFNLSEPLRRALTTDCRRQALISATATFSGGWLRKIAEELTTNELLKRVWSIKPITPWKESEEINFLVNGKRRQIMARGSACQLRGEHFDLIILDDLEDIENVRSETQRAYLADWFYQTVVGSMETHTKLLMIGTLIHHYCLLSTLVGDPTLGKPAKPGWETRIYRAVEHGTLDDPRCGVLWPEKCNRRFLVSQKLEMGDIRFARELMNDPAPDEAVVFKEYWFKDRRYTVPPPAQNMQVCMFLDPNGGDDGRGRRSKSQYLDYAAIAVVGVVKHQPTPPTGYRGGDIYVLDVVRGRWDFLAMLEACYAQHQKWGINTFFFESNQFQAVIGQAFSQYCSERKFYPAVLKMDSINSKEARARSVSNLCEQGRVWLPSDLADVTAQELFSFPVVDHDDQVDAFVGALRGVRHFSEMWGDQPVSLPDENKVTIFETNSYIEELKRDDSEYRFDTEGKMHQVRLNLSSDTMRRRKDLESW